MYTANRWLKNYVLILKDTLAGTALLWMLVEAGSHFGDGKIDAFNSFSVFISILIILFLLAIFKNKPKTTFSYKLRGVDSCIEVKVGDIFDNNGSVVVPINNNLDAVLGGNVQKAKSVQNSLISRLYSGDGNLLQKEINTKIDRNENTIFDIGTVVEVFLESKKIYLLVNSIKKQNNRVESNIDDFLLSLSKLWNYILDETDRDDIITLPLIGTRHGRSQDLNRTTALKEIIYNYIESSKSRAVCDRLIISILPADIINGDIDLDEINEYLKYHCKHYRVVTLSNELTGKGISSSITINIEN